MTVGRAFSLWMWASLAIMFSGAVSASQWVVIVGGIAFIVGMIFAGLSWRFK